MGSRSRLLVLCLCSLAGMGLSAERSKRELRFPKGGSFVAAVALASLLPKGPTDGFAHVLEFDLGFPFPEKLAIGKVQTKKKIKEEIPLEGIMRKTERETNHKDQVFRRNLKERQRQHLIRQIEDVIVRTGFNGSSCFSRFQCELQNLSSKNSLLEELLFALFHTPHLGDNQCHQPHHACPLSLLQILMHSQQIPPP